MRGVFCVGPAFFLALSFVCAVPGASAQQWAVGSSQAPTSPPAASGTPRLYLGGSLLASTNREADTTGCEGGHGGFCGSIGGTAPAASLAFGVFATPWLSVELEIARNGTQTGSAYEIWQRLDITRIDETYSRQEDLISVGGRWHLRTSGRPPQIEPVAGFHWANVKSRLTERTYRYTSFYWPDITGTRPDVEFTSRGFGVSGGLYLLFPLGDRFALTGGGRLRWMKWEDADVPEGTLSSTVPPSSGPIVFEIGIGLRWTWPTTRGRASRARE